MTSHEIGEKKRRKIEKGDNKKKETPTLRYPRNPKIILSPFPYSKKTLTLCIFLVKEAQCKLNIAKEESGVDQELLCEPLRRSEELWYRNKLLKTEEGEEELVIAA